MPPLCPGSFYLRGRASRWSWDEALVTVVEPKVLCKPAANDWSAGEI